MHSLLSLLLAVAPAAAASVPGAVLVQDEAPDKREEIASLIDLLEDHVKERGEQDLEAIAIIDQLLAEFPKSGPKDRADIVKAVSKTLHAKRQESAEGVRDNKLYLAAAVALGHMGPESAGALEGWIDHKTHRKDLTLQRELVLSLGKTGEPDGIDPLTDLLNHHEASLQAAAAEALANFSDRDQKVRKDVFEEILKVLTAVKTRVDQDVNDIIARERYDVISASMITSLQALSGHDERDPAEWQRWWNKNKKRDWDEET